MSPVPAPSFAQPAPFVTGEAVALDLQLAALPSRVLAGLLDGLIQLSVIGVLTVVGVLTPVDLSAAAAAALGVVAVVLVLVVYPVSFETLLRGRTPGKAAMGLRVVRDDGGPIGFRQALVRGLTGAAVERPGLTLFFGGIVSMLLSERSKRLGDLLAGTVVVRERVTGRPATMASMPPPLAGWAGSLDLSGLSDELAISVRQFLSRAASLTPEARDELGGRLVPAVVAAVGPPPLGTPGWAVLSAVLAERRQREEQRLTARPAGSASPAPGPRLPAAWSGSPHPRPSAPQEPPSPGPGGFVLPS